MKKVLSSLTIIAILSSCNNSAPPKEVAAEFIEAVYAGDASKASELTTEKTKPVIANLPAQAANLPAEESFSLTTLKETENGNGATVKNDLVSIPLEKEGDGWKVAATPELVAGISNRQADLTALKNKWEALLKEYEGRLQIAKEYVQYKKGQGALSTQMQSLEQMVNTLSTKTTWDKEKIGLYVQRQGQLADMIDKSVEPSYTASADISMNYILQLHNADSRIEAATKEYQAQAQKTPSATYPALAGK
jgi:hypothetical protein